jgi:ABC-type Fe3+ transport system permease subunit
MKLNIKRLTAGLLVVPLLVLGIGVFSAAPAYAIPNCPDSTSGYTSSSDGCKNKSGGTEWWYQGAKQKDAATWKQTNKDACDPQSGASGGIKCAHGNDQPSDLFGAGGIVTLIINVLLFVIGILCVIMIIFGGIRYTTSTGDKTRVDAAKNTIIYAVVGLVVAIVAYALVNWVFGALQG